MREVRCEVWRREKSSERRAADGLQQRLKLQNVAAAETTAQAAAAAAAAAFAAYFAVILLGQNLRIFAMFGLIKVKADNLRHMTMCEFARSLKATKHNRLRRFARPPSSSSTRLLLIFHGLYL